MPRNHYPLYRIDVTAQEYADLAGNYDPSTAYFVAGALKTIGASPVSGGGAGFVKNESTGFAETTVGAETFVALPVEGDNAKANVNHRTGTLAQLKTLVGGDGEIAVATDADAIVVYDGVTAGGVTFYKPTTTKVLVDLFNEVPASVADASDGQVMNLQGSPTDAAGLSVAASGVITLPVGYKWFALSGIVSKDSDTTPNVTHQIQIQYSALAAGPYVTGPSIGLKANLSSEQGVAQTLAAGLEDHRYVRLTFYSGSATDTVCGISALIEVGV